MYATAILTTMEDSTDEERQKLMDKEHVPEAKKLSKRDGTRCAITLVCAECIAQSCSSLKELIPQHIPFCALYSRRMCCVCVPCLCCVWGDGWGCMHNNLPKEPCIYMHN